MDETISKVSIVLINWNNSSDTIECLESLKEISYPDYNIFLLDNNSEDNSQEEITKYLSTRAENNEFNYDVIDVVNLNKDYSNLDLLYIINDVNSGFASGNNIVLKYIRDYVDLDYVLLLNNDTIVVSDFLDCLVKTASSMENIGFTGIRTYYYDDPQVLQTIGGSLIDSVHCESCAITCVSDKMSVCDFITGSCMLVKRDVLDTVGFFDSKLFMYWEDADWCIRGRNKGYISVTSPDSMIYHKDGGSSSNDFRLYYHTRNRVYLMRKNSGNSRVYYHFLIYIVLYVFKTSFMEFVHGNFSTSKVFIKGLFDGLRLKKEEMG